MLLPSAFELLAEPLAAVLTDLNYREPTPVQAQCLPVALQGRDLLATAQTGTGKTAAFVLPLLSRMIAGTLKGSALIVTPTREIAEQIGRVLLDMTKRTPQYRMSVIIGGAAYPEQIASLAANPAFVVGTPGRLIDQAKLGHLRLAEFGALVIDEADRLLDMGFEAQMNDLVARLPRQRQTMLFSATLADPVAALAARFLTSPERVAIGAPATPIDKIRQVLVYLAPAEKDERLLRELARAKGSVIVFVKTKFKAEKLGRALSDAGHTVTRIHGDRTQAQRSAAIEAFRTGTARIMVATDIAARGLDIPNVEHVINYDLPLAPEDYVHRIGRTARAGASGASIAFVTPDETLRWAQIHLLIYGKLPPRDQMRSVLSGASGAPNGGLDRKAAAYARKHGLDLFGVSSKNGAKPSGGAGKGSKFGPGPKTAGGAKPNSQDGKLLKGASSDAPLSRAEKRAAQFGAPAAAGGKGPRTAGSPPGFRAGYRAGKKKK